LAAQDVPGQIWGLQRSSQLLAYSYEVRDHRVGITILCESEEKRMEPKDDRSSRNEVTLPYGSMAKSVDRWTRGALDCPSPVPSLFFFRREALSRPVVCLVEPSLLLVVQGEKEMLVGEKAFPYGVGQFLLTSIDLPANSRVIEASPERPCLGLMLRLDFRILSELISQGAVAPGPQESSGWSMELGTVTPELLDPIRRLLRLLDEPAALSTLAPLILREIHYRLLASDQVPRLLQIISAGSRGQRIAKAIDWLKLNYASALRVEELAGISLMSPSTFHQRFRELTSMSPLQYQKWLRLNEARRLMINEGMDVSSASYRVGYESPSQFSREYNRLFGMPPKRDVEELRRRASVGVA
jgi:AraC-like DNA-binding protein